MEKKGFHIEADPSDSHESELCYEVLWFMNAICKEDVLHETISKKDDIFKQVDQKIRQHDRHVVPLTSKRRWIWGSVASVILLCIVVGYGGYLFGYNASYSELAQTDITVIAPLGTTTRVELPDKSEVVLNAGSFLKYPSFFQKQRTVTLVGEGFFNVEKSEIPFIVRTENLSVSVLGTRFNLRAYGNEEQTQVTLEEGLVEVFTNTQSNESLQLHPDQQLVLNHQTGELKREVVNVTEYMAWQKGNLVFKDISLADIVKNLERKFNTHIRIIDPDLTNERYYVTFEHNESLNEILNLLSYKREWTFKKNEDVIRIIKR